MRSGLFTIMWAANNFDPEVTNDFKSKTSSQEDYALSVVGWEGCGVF